MAVAKKPRKKSDVRRSGGDSTTYKGKAPYGRTEDRSPYTRKGVIARAAEGPKKSTPRKKPRNSVGNVSSQMGGKNYMGRRDGGPAATADGRERVGKQSTKAVRKYQGAEGPKKSTPRKTTTRKKAR